MSRDGQAHDARAQINDAVDGGCKARGVALPRQEFAIHARQSLAGLDNSIGFSSDFLGWQTAGNDHGQQCGGHSVTNSVRDEQAHMMLIQAAHIVDVATDIVHGAPQGGHRATRKCGQLLWQKLSLHLSS